MCLTISLFLNVYRGGLSQIQIILPDKVVVYHIVMSVRYSRSGIHNHF